LQDGYSGSLNKNLKPIGGIKMKKSTLYGIFGIALVILALAFTGCGSGSGGGGGDVLEGTWVDGGNAYKMVVASGAWTLYDNSTGSWVDFLKGTYSGTSMTAVDYNEHLLYGLGSDPVSWKTIVGSDKESDVTGKWGGSLTQEVTVDGNTATMNGETFTRQ
jgi:hypothetical protein